MFNKIIAFFKKRNKFKFNANHIIVEAFECNGIKYYMFEDPMNLPAQRGLYAMEAYEEMNMRCDKEYLKAYIEAVETILKPTKGLELLKLAKLTNDLKNRINFIIEPNLVYKLATVVFFDESEDPYKWERKHAEFKITEWKKNMDVESFFFKTPLMTLVPYLNSFSGDTSAIEIHSKIANLQNENHWQTLTEVLSEEVVKKYKNNSWLLPTSISQN